MNKLVYVRIGKGCHSAEELAEECRRNGHLVSVIQDPFINGVRKYYTFDNRYKDDRPMEITIANNRIVSAKKVPKKVLKTLPPLIPPQFGNF